MLFFAAVMDGLLILNEQCAIPVFDGLFPEPHQGILMDLLFELATWHALAKLRLHTESTITALEHSTQCLGKAIWTFKEKLCANYVVGTLPAEDAPRAKGKAAKHKWAKENADRASNEAPGTKPKAKKKVHNLNLKTYKLHALRHYVDAICRFGPSDGYSTQTVSFICST